MATDINNSEKVKFFRGLRPESKKGTQKLRIGIYAGVFDPVHAGHIAFALQARAAANLDQIIFLPERRPRYKPSVEHYAHRVAMLKSALAPHPDLAVMEIVDRHFSVKRLLPMLQSLYPEAELVFLMGSDAFLSLPAWQYAEQMMASCEFVVGMRAQDQRHLVEQSIGTWPVAPPSLMIFESFAPDISSSHIRSALRENRTSDGLLHSVRRYARQEWLYVSPGAYVA